MGDMLIMSKRELERKTLLDAYLYKKMTLQDASKKMRLSYRQSKRVLKDYLEYGDEGLIHKHRGRISPNRHDPDFKGHIISIYKNKYLDFGPTFASEKLHEDDGITIHPETLRKWLKAEGLWHKKRKRKVYRERRERRPCFGELLQIDGSIHQWFYGDDNYYCLLNIVDDATGKCLARLDKGETTKSLLIIFKSWIKKYGIPKAVYVDLKSVYVSPKRMKEKYDDDLLIKDGFSVFEQVCKDLNIEIIRAYSPEAKGRVERKHAVFQDRLVKDLKLYGINNLEGANRYLKNKFLNNINKKFAKPPTDNRDAHRDPKPYGNLNEIFCWRYRRQLKNDWTVRFIREYYQIHKGYEKSLQPSEFVVIKKYLDGSIVFWSGKQRLKYTKLNSKLYIIPEPSFKPKGPPDPLIRSKISRKNKHRTPWSSFNPGWLKSA
jgi:transposase